MVTLLSFAALGNFAAPFCCCHPDGYSMLVTVQSVEQLTSSEMDGMYHANDLAIFAETHVSRCWLDYATLVLRAAQVDQRLQPL